MGDIYLETNGLKFAIVRSYKVVEEKDNGYNILLDKIYLTDEFIEYQAETGNSYFPYNFRMVIEKPYCYIVYSHCAILSFEADDTNVVIFARERNEISKNNYKNEWVKSKYSDSTLRNMSKDDLIQYIRLLEHNYAVAIEFNEQQAHNIENFLKGLKENG